MVSGGGQTPLAFPMRTGLGWFLTPRFLRRYTLPSSAFSYLAPVCSSIVPLGSWLATSGSYISPLTAIPYLTGLGSVWFGYRSVPSPTCWQHIPSSHALPFLASASSSNTLPIQPFALLLASIPLQLAAASAFPTHSQRPSLPTAQPTFSPAPQPTLTFIASPALYYQQPPAFGWMPVGYG